MDLEGKIKDVHKLEEEARKRKEKEKDKTVQALTEQVMEKINIHSDEKRISIQD